jgi:hypothetical protein
LQEQQAEGHHANARLSHDHQHHHHHHQHDLQSGQTSTSSSQAAYTQRPGRGLRSGRNSGSDSGTGVYCSGGAAAATGMSRRGPSRRSGSESRPTFNPRTSFSSTSPAGPAPYVPSQVQMAAPMRAAAHVRPPHHRHRHQDSNTSISPSLMFSSSSSSSGAVHGRPRASGPGAGLATGSSPDSYFTGSLA